MQERPQKSVKTKNKKISKIKAGRLIAFVCVAMYGIMFFHAFFGQMIKTYIVNYGTIEDTENVMGYIIRNEKVISSDKNATLKPVKNDGERVAKGTVIATLGGQSTNTFEKKVAEIDEKIEQVAAEQNKNQINTEIFSSDIRSIDKDIEYKVFELSSKISSQEFSNITKLKADIDANLKQRAEISGQLGPASQYIKNLISQRDYYKKSITDQEQKVRADSAGVVSYQLDGYESVFNLEKIGDIDISQLEALKSPQLIANNSGIKIVDNFMCYIAIVLENKSKLSKLKVGDKLTIKLSDIGDDTISASISSIADKGQGKTLVVFSINQNIDKLLNFRKTNIEIIWSSYNGLKIPTTSLVNKNGKVGVMSVRANYARFREVEIVKEYKDFTIVKENGSPYDNGINLYEEIVINGANVKEGRPIRNSN